MVFQENFKKGFSMKYAIVILSTIFLLFCMMACTYNISMAHTQGLADDVIDDTASNTPNVSPNLNIPMSPK